jgi:hypothetical protein
MARTQDVEWASLTFSRDVKVSMKRSFESNHMRSIGSIEVTLRHDVPSRNG